MCASRLARSVPSLAALNSSSSGIVLQRKYDRRLASWYSVISNTLPVPSGFGSRSMRNRNSGDISAARSGEARRLIERFAGVRERQRGELHQLVDLALRHRPPERARRKHLEVEADLRLAVGEVLAELRARLVELAPAD